jgi:exopolysaccharide production protein ExoZ
MPISNYFLVQHGCFFGLGILFWTGSTWGLSIVRLALFATAVAACLGEICFVGNGPLMAPQFWVAPAVWSFAVVAIFLSMKFPFDGGWIARALGLMTYPMYLVHEKLGAAFLRSAPYLGRWGALALAVCATLVVSLAVTRLELFIRPALERSLDAIVERFPKPIVLLLFRRSTPVRL